MGSIPVGKLRKSSFFFPSIQLEHVSTLISILRTLKLQSHNETLRPASSPVRSSHHVIPNAATLVLLFLAVVVSLFSTSASISDI